MRYRSSYLGDFALYSGGLDRQNVLGETIYDAQVGYDFRYGRRSTGLSLYVQGQNLTDTRSATLGIVTQPLSLPEVSDLWAPLRRRVHLQVLMTRTRLAGYPARRVGCEGRTCVNGRPSRS